MGKQEPVTTIANRVIRSRKDAQSADWCQEGRANHGHALPLLSREQRPQAEHTGKQEGTQAKSEHRRQTKQTERGREKLPDQAEN